MFHNPSTIITDFKHAAVNAKKAGFDGVERSYISFVIAWMTRLKLGVVLNIVHGANGYLVQ